MQEGDFN